MDNPEIRRLLCEKNSGEQNFANHETHNGLPAAIQVEVIIISVMYRHTLMLQIFLVVRFVHLEIICR